jgi:hypothetical protein
MGTLGTQMRGYNRCMTQKASILWISAAGVIGIIFGVFYGIFGLDGLPVYQKLVPSEVYTSWANGLYGSTFIGFSTLLFFVGRRAFQVNDKELMRALLYGINAWLIVEALFSLYFGVYFNIAVDIALSAFLSYPFVRGIKSSI